MQVDTAERRGAFGTDPPHPLPPLPPKRGCWGWGDGKERNLSLSPPFFWVGLGFLFPADWSAAQAAVFPGAPPRPPNNARS